MPTAACLLRVWVRQQNVSLGYALHQNEERREALRVEVRKLEVARASGRTPRALMASARALGLGPARPHQFVGVGPADSAPPSGRGGPLGRGGRGDGRGATRAPERGMDAKPQ